LLIGTVHKFGVHPVTVHIFAPISGICRAKDAWFRLLRQPRSRIAIDGSQADATPSHAAFDRGQQTAASSFAAPLGVNGEITSETPALSTARSAFLARKSMTAVANTVAHSEIPRAPSQ